MRRTEQTLVEQMQINDVEIQHRMNLLGLSSLNYALLLAPVALVFVVNEGFQPFFVLFIGLILAIFFSSISEEEINKKILIQKLLAIIVMFIGTYLINTA